MLGKLAGLAAYYSSECPCDSGHEQNLEDLVANKTFRADLF